MCVQSSTFGTSGEEHSDSSIPAFIYLNKNNQDISNHPRKMSISGDRMKQRGADHTFFSTSNQGSIKETIIEIQNLTDPSYHRKHL